LKHVYLRPMGCASYITVNTMRSDDDLRHKSSADRISVAALLSAEYGPVSVVRFNDNGCFYSRRLQLGCIIRLLL